MMFSNLWRGCMVILCIGLVVCMRTPTAHATVDGFQPAVNAIGQNDTLLVDPGPIYTKGTANNGSNKLGLNAPIIGIAVDTVDHRLFVSDTTNNRVLVYNLTAGNALIDRIPDNVLGQMFFYNNAVATTQLGLSAPNGLAYDSTNKRLFVADTTNNRVKAYDVTSITDGEDSTAVLGQTTFTTATAATTQEGMNSPTGLVYDGTATRLYVAQSLINRVTVYDVATIGNGESAVNVLGQANFTTATAGITQATMNVPMALALSGTSLTTLFVSESSNNRVTAFDVTSIADGENAVSVLGQANFTTATAATTQAGMNAPRGIAYSPTSKRVFVSQLTANRVTVYDVAAITNGENAISVLGQANFTTSTAATTQAGLNGPTGVLPESTTGLLYVPQSTASRVSIFDVTAITDGENATDLLGQYDDNSSAPAPVYTKATANNVSKYGLSTPRAVTIDSVNHRLFVADTTNNRVLVYNLTAANAPVDRIPDNVLGQLNFYSNAVATTQIGLSAPVGLAFDPVGNKLFVSDQTNSRVIVYDTASITDGENAVNVIGQINFTTATATTTQFGLNAPTQIDYDSETGKLFVADTSNNRIMIFSGSTLVNGSNALDMIGQDDGTVSAPLPIYTKAGANNSPHKLGMNAPILGIVMDTVGHRLFVSDTTNNRILVYNLDASNILLDRTPDNVLGQTNFYTTSAASTRNGLNVPNGLAYDSARNLLFVVQTTNRVTTFDVTSIVDGEDAINVLGQTSFTATTAATTQVGLNVPTGAVYDATRKRLFVAQNTGNRVSVFTLSGSLTSYSNADNVLGQNDSFLASPAPIYTKSTAQNGPNSLGYSAPVMGLTVDTVDHRLFMSDTSNNRVLVYNLDGSNALIDRIPDNVLGQVNYYTNAAASTQIGLSAPNGLAYDSFRKRLFVAESSGNRVKVFDVTSITDGEAAANVLGQVAFTTSTAGITQSTMNVPTGVAYGGSGSRLYVAENSNNRVTVYDVAGITNGENAVAVLGKANFTTSTAGLTQATMNVPFSVTLSGSLATTLFVSEGSNNRVLAFDVTSTTDGENAVSVLGQANFTTATAASTQAGMNAPRGIAYNSSTKALYVAQTTGQRVTLYDVATITNGENAINVLGQTNFTASTGANTQSGLNGPSGIAIDEAGAKVYVSQSTANRISVFDSASIADGENAVDALGQYDDDLSTPGPIYTKGNIHNGPSKLGLSAGIIGLALDPTDHRLFVSDTGNNRVLVYNLDANDLLLDRIPDKVLGQLNFYSNAAGSTREGLNVPNGLAYDTDGKRLFVAQTTGNRVTVYDVATITDGEDAVNVLGQTSFITATAATTQAGLNVPTGVVYDNTNDRLFVAQNTGNRVSVFNLAAGLDDNMSADNALGQYDDSLSAPSPIYTKGATHDGPNRLGFSGPNLGLALDPTDHRLFLSDTANNRVLVYNLDSNNLLIDRIPDKVLGQLNFYSATLATSQVGLNVPAGLAYDDANNRLFIAQQQDNRVTVYDVATITDGEGAMNVLGQTTFTTATAATTQVGMNEPAGVAYDSTNQRLFVAQNTGNRVTVYDVTTITNGENAVSVLGQANFTATTAATTQAGMNVPYGLALSGSTVLFVSQRTGNRVTTYDVTAITNGENAVNVLGQANFTATTAATTQAGMNGPRGIAYNAATKTLYVAQTTGNRVTTYDVAAITDGEDAISVLGQTNFTNTAAATTQGGLNAPNDVLIDNANTDLYVMQSGASRVSVFDVASISDGENATDLLGQYDSDLTTPGPIYTKNLANNGPNKLGLSSLDLGLALDPTDHRLFVSDSGNNRVLVYNLDNNDLLLDRIPDKVLGQPDFHSKVYQTTQAGLKNPLGLSYDDANNRLFVASYSNRVTIYDVTAITDGENAINVLGQTNFTNEAAATTQDGMNSPSGLTYDSTNQRLFVASANSHRVTVYDVTAITDGENAVNVLGQTNFTNATQATTQAGMNQPYGVTLSGSTVLFVAQGSGNRVTTYDITAITDGENAVNVLGQTTFTATTAATTQAGMNAPYAISYDATNKRLYVTNGQRVTVYDTASITDGENAINVIGQANFTTNNSLTDRQGLSSPTGVLADPAHNRLYVLDLQNYRVLSYNTQSGIGNGEPAANVLGQANFTATAAGITQATMNVPFGVTLSGSTVTTLFVSDASNNRVLAFDVTAVTDGENAVSVLGQANFTTATAATTQAGMNAPRGISYDAINKRLYVAQTTGARVTVYDVATVTNGENAINVLGQSAFTTNTALVDREGLSTPTAVLSDPLHHRLYVMDSTANRVLTYTTNVGIANGMNATGVLGQANFTATAAGITQATMNVPFDVTLSGSTVPTLFVSDASNNRVLAFDVTAVTDGENAVSVLGQANFTTATAATTQAGMNAPRGIAYHPSTKTLFVAQVTANRVTTYDVGAITNGENAVRVLGQPNFTLSTAATRQAGLNGPTGVLIDSTNNTLYVPQSTSHRVSIFNVASISDGEDATNMLGQTDNELNPPGPIYVKGTVSNASYKMGLSAPAGLVVDGVNHRLFVADSSNNRILVYNLTAGNMPIDRIPDNVLGQPNYWLNTVATTQFGLSGPHGLAFDGTANKLYVTDMSNNRIMVYDTASISDGEFAVQVLGQPSFLTTNASITQTGLSTPRLLEYDSTSGMLFVADGVNNRVLLYGVGTPTSSGGGDTFHFFGF